MSGISAYLVDANNGRSSMAVALNSVFRGVFAFVATEITVPLQVCVYRNPVFFFMIIDIFLIHTFLLLFLGFCRRW